MNFEERTNRIGRLLRETILPRYKRPEHLDDETARAELRDMVTDLNAEWPLMPAERFEITGQAMARALRTTYTGRTWPTIAHLTKALKAAMAPPDKLVEGKPASKVDILDIRRQQLLAWCKGEEPCPEHLITHANLRTLAEDGDIPRDEVGRMLSFAAQNLGVASDEPTTRAPNGGVTIGLKRFGGADA